MDPAGFFSLAVEVFDTLGVIVICIGTLIAAWFAVRKLFTGEAHSALQVFRDMMGGAILLGLEVFVAGDLIKTITQTPTIDSVIVLGLIVLVRTILSFTIQIEIEGTLPWRRALLTSGATIAARAARTSEGM